MRGKTLPQFNATPVPSAPRVPRGTTVISHQDLLVEAARNVVRAFQSDSSVTPLGVREAIEAVNDAIKAHERRAAAEAEATVDSSPPPRFSSAPPPGTPVPAGDMEAWWQIQAVTRVDQPTRYVVRWAEPTGDGHFMLRETEKDSVADCLTLVLRPGE